MKKYLYSITIIISILLLTGCFNNTSDNKNSTIENYNGKVTDVSKKFLDKGNIINITRTVIPLGDDDESYGKGYIKMTFNVINEYSSMADFNPTDDYKIKKKIISNIKLISTPKMGIADTIYVQTGYNYDDIYKIKGSNNKYEVEYSNTAYAFTQSSLSVELNKIALYDTNTSPSAANGNQPSLSQVYQELGISRDQVALKLGFRVELIMESGKVLYKDFIVDMPPVGIDIASSEFHYDYTTNDTNEMATYLEKQ